MTTYLDIANSVSWATKENKTAIWHNNFEKTFVFIGKNIEDDPLFLNICKVLQCKKSSEDCENINYGIIFTEDEKCFFQTGKTERVETILFCPLLDNLRMNGALKKTLWQYFSNFGML